MGSTNVSLFYVNMLTHNYSIKYMISYLCNYLIHAYINKCFIYFKIQTECTFGILEMLIMARKTPQGFFSPTIIFLTHLIDCLIYSFIHSYHPYSVYRQWKNWIWWWWWWGGGAWLIVYTLPNPIWLIRQMSLDTEYLENSFSISIN